MRTNNALFFFFFYCRTTERLLATSICRSVGDRGNVQFRIRVNVTETNGISIGKENDIMSALHRQGVRLSGGRSCRGHFGWGTTQLKRRSRRSYPHVGAVTLLLSGDAQLERCQPLALNYSKMP